MKSRVNTFHAETYINKFEQIIEPNDRVMFASTSWKRTSFRDGFFNGVNKNKRGEVVSVRVSYPAVKRVPNGKTELTSYNRYNYTTRKYEEVTYDRVLYDKVPSTGYSTLPLMRVFKLAE